MSSQAVRTIQQNLSLLGQVRWGLIIYRCTYNNDKEWQLFMTKWRTLTQQNFQDEGEEGQQLLQQLDWTVIEDRGRFDGASKATIRQAFQQWVDAVTADDDQPGSAAPPSKTPAPRYRYCISVDEDSLRSLLSQGTGSSTSGVEDGAYVNLIKRRWPDRDFLPQHIREALEREEREVADDDDVDDGGEDDDALTEIEGCTDEDVGFMKAAPQYMYAGTYHYLDNGSDWHLAYVRPPQIGPI